MGWQPSQRTEEDPNDILTSDHYYKQDAFISIIIKNFYE